MRGAGSRATRRVAPTRTNAASNRPARAVSTASSGQDGLSAHRPRIQHLVGEREQMRGSRSKGRGKLDQARLANARAGRLTHRRTSRTALLAPANSRTMPDRPHPLAESDSEVSITSAPPSVSANAGTITPEATRAGTWPSAERECVPYREIIADAPCALAQHRCDLSERRRRCRQKGAWTGFESFVDCA